MSRWCLVWIILAAHAPAVLAQPWPAAHPKAAATLERLLASGVKTHAIGLKRAGPMRLALYGVADSHRLSALLAAQRSDLTDALCDAMVLRWRDAVPDERTFWVSLLQAVADQSKSSRTRAFAELFAGFAMASQSGPGKSALDRYAQARRSFHEAGDPKWEAATELETGNALFQAEQFDPALTAFERARKLYAGVFGPTQVLVSGCLRNSGNVYYRRQQYRDAIRYYRQALEALGPAKQSRTLARAGCLQNLGHALEAVGDTEGAAAAVSEGLSIVTEKLSPDAPQQLPFLEQLAFIYRSRAEWDAAIQKYERALEVARKAFGRDCIQAVRFLRLSGNVQNSRGRARAALALHQEALRVLNRLPADDLSERAEGEDAIAGDYRDLAEAGPARTHWHTALRLYQQQNARSSQLEAGFVLLHLAQLEAGQHGAAAGTLYRQAIETASRAVRKDNLMLLHFHHAYGLYLQSQGPVAEAIPQFERARQIARQSKNEIAWAEESQSLGSAYVTAGDLDAATTVLQEALAVYRKLQHPRLASCYASLAEIDNARDEYEQSIALLKQAVHLQTTVSGPDTPATLHLLDMLGTTQLADHRYADAERTCQQLLEATRRVSGSDHPDVGDRLLALARIQADQEKYEPAARQINQALAIYRKHAPSTHLQVVQALDQLGQLRQRAQHAPAALDAYRQALTEIREAGMSNTVIHAEVLRHGADALLATRDRAAAERRWQDAWRVCRHVYGAGHQRTLTCLGRLADLQEAAGDLPGALHWIDEALSASRQTPLSGSSSTRTGSLAWRSTGQTARLLGQKARYTLKLGDGSVRAYQQALQLLEEAGQVLDRERSEERTSVAAKLAVSDALSSEQIILRLVVCEVLAQKQPAVPWLTRAFAACEEGHARVFLEQLGKARAGLIGGLPARLGQREQTLNRQWRQLEREVSVREVVPFDRRDPAVMQRLLQSQRQTEQAMDGLQQTIGRDYPGVASFRRPNPCSLADARDCLDPDEVALIYMLGERFSYVLLMQARPAPGDPQAGLAIFALPGRRVLTEKVEALVQRERLERSAATREQGAELYQLLLGPLAGRLRGKALVIVPDGVLGYLPFELLVEGGPNGPFLLEQHRIRYAPSLTALHLIRLWQQKRPQPSQPLYAFGDPDYGSQQLAATREIRWREGGAGTFPRLVHSGEEVRAIGKLLGAAAGTVLTGRQASEAAVKRLSADGKLSQARYLHFATHGILGFGRGQQPALVLSQRSATGRADAQGRDDGLLTLAEVSALKLNADLVVLSACRSGRGQLHRGEGVSGLARAFLYAGSRGVVCSLWSVDDAATSTLMQALYRQLQQGVPATEALRQAKLQLLHDDQPPVLWAPFVLLGR